MNPYARQKGIRGWQTLQVKSRDIAINQLLTLAQPYRSLLKTNSPQHKFILVLK